MSSQHQALRPNPKKANQYVLNVKHELTYMQGKAYSSLDEHAQAWLDLILRAAHPIFSKKLGDKQRGRPSNTWFDRDCREARRNYHIVLNSSHSVSTSRIAFKKYRTMIRHKKRSYLERKQKELHLLLKRDPKLFWKSFEEKDDLTLPFTPQEAVDYCTKLYTSGQSINDHFVPNTQLPNVFTKGEIWATMKDLANHKASDIHGLKPKFLKWAANDLCEPITKLFNLVAREGFPTSWTTNIIQMIFKSGERNSMGNYRTIMLGTIFGKLYGSDLEKIINRWAELKGVRPRGQASFREGRSTLDHILTLRTLIEKEIFEGRCLYSCFVDFKKAFDTVPRDKLWERLRRLGVPLHLQQAV